MLEGIVQVLPSGWRFPDICRSMIVYKNTCYQTDGFVASPISETCPIKVDGNIVGSIEIVYTKNVPKTEDGYFLERESMPSVTCRRPYRQMLLYRRMKSVINDGRQQVAAPADESRHNEWESS
jgi:hypothetical protein